MRLIKKLLLSVTIVGASGALVLAAYAGFGQRTAAAAASAPMDGATQSAILDATKFGRIEALTYVQQLKAITPRIDRIDAKLTTWGDFIDHEGSTDAPTVAALTPVWVVAVSGDVLPTSARGNYPWAVFVFNGLNGRTIATFANDRTPWPAYFDALADASR